MRSAMGARTPTMACAAVVVGLVVVVAASRSGDRPPAPAGATSTASAVRPADMGADTPAVGPAVVLRAAAVRSPAAPAPSVAPQDARVEPPVPLGSAERPEFRVDGQGELIVDSRTRAELERLLALNDRGPALALLQQTAAILPPTAYRQATDAFYAYEHYTMALRQTVAAGGAVVGDADGAQQLRELEALRVAHFGPATAQAFFGDETEAARRLLDPVASVPPPGGSGTPAELSPPSPGR